MKELSSEAKLVLLWVGIIATMAGMRLFFIDLPERAERQAKIDAKIKKQYNSLEVLKYSGDTIEFVFHDEDVKWHFEKAWKSYNYGLSIEQFPYGENMHVLKQKGDTIQIKFDNAKFQRQFEKQWRKYSNHKLNHINKNVKKR